MIKTAADILNGIRLKEAELLGSQDIKHPGIIGQMYEGLTKDILERIVPSTLNIHVASGLIENKLKQRSKQIDCMLVVGEGRRIPYTSEQVFDIDNVVAVIEVKKHLYASTLESGYQNLLSVSELVTSKPIILSILNDAFCGITGLPLPTPDNVSKHPFHIQMIYHALVVESYQPIRIIFGYDGFSTEYMLRESMIDYLEKNTRQKGFGPASFPSLIICNTHSLIKLNGMPYCAWMTDDFWCFYGSSNSNPLLLLIELLFTRLTYSHKIKVFDGGLNMETLRPLLFGKCVDLGTVQGWEFKAKHTSSELLQTPTTSTDWSPQFIDICEFVVISRLLKGEEEDITSQGLIDFANSNGYTIDSLVESLKSKRLAGVEDNKLVLLGVIGEILILPDGRIAVGEGNTGRLAKWLEENNSP